MFGIVMIVPFGWCLYTFHAKVEFLQSQALAFFIFYFYFMKL